MESDKVLTLKVFCVVKLILSIGQLTLKNLRLKKGALDKFRLPVDVLEGGFLAFVSPTQSHSAQDTLGSSPSPCTG